MTTNRRLLDVTTLYYPDGRESTTSRATGIDMDRANRRTSRFPDPPGSVHIGPSVNPFEIKGAAGPACPKCHRPDCGLLATVIIGEANWYAAAGECFEEQRALASGPRMRIGGEQFRMLREAGIV